MALKVGDVAPDFEYTDNDGIVKNFHDLTGKKIVFFFPKAFTPGCTAQACSIQENYENLKFEGTSEVFGISIDSPDKLSKFKDEYDLEFTLIADEDGKISKNYDVYNNFLLTKISGRVTYTVENNTIVSVVDSGIRGNKNDNGLKNHGKELLDILKLND